MNDPEKRLAALREYEIMDTPPEEVFDDLTKLTSCICGTPIALVTLLDTRRQWFKSKVGISISETPLEHAFCAHALEQEGVFLVPDAETDERFRLNPLVVGDPYIRFYAGAPLITPSGVFVGMLCAIDRVPRQLSAEQLEGLKALARQVIRALEMRRTLKALREALAEKAAAEEEVSTLKQLLPMCGWCRKVREDASFWRHVESYLEEHANVRVSHGVCPDCAVKLGLETE
jgi:GAF domain-containing protein